jgi:protein-disulfide isomerase
MVYTYKHYYIHLHYLSMNPEAQNPTHPNSDSRASATSTNGIGPKDLLIPVSIVIAGLFIGLGLYFSGGSAQLVPVGEMEGDQAQPQSLQQRLLGLVEAAGVDEDEFLACAEGQETVGEVQEDLDNAVATGGRGTPWSIVIGPGGKTYPLNGAVGPNQVEQVLALARSEAAQGPSGESETDNVNPVTESDHIKGNPTADIVIVEYSDFDCPFCGRFHATLEQIVANNDDVAWVYRHFPLAQLHPNAAAVAAAAECVAKLNGNDAFWTFADGYFGI